MPNALPLPRSGIEQHRGVVDQDVDGTNFLRHRSLRCGDALEARDDHLHGERAMLALFRQSASRTFESWRISPSEGHGKALRQQLSSCLESEATIRAGHERDVCVVVFHGSILPAEYASEPGSQDQRLLSAQRAHAVKRTGSVM